MDAFLDGADRCRDCCVLAVKNIATATPVFGGQLALGGFGIVGNNSTALDGILTLASGPFTITRQGSIGQTTTRVGDLYPQATIRWNNGVNNWMIYGTGDMRHDRPSGWNRWLTLSLSPGAPTNPRSALLKDASSVKLPATRQSRPPFLNVS